MCVLMPLSAVNAATYYFKLKSGTLQFSTATTSIGNRKKPLFGQSSGYWVSDEVIDQIRALIKLNQFMSDKTFNYSVILCLQ